MRAFFTILVGKQYIIKTFFMGSTMQFQAIVIGFLCLTIFLFSRELKAREMRIEKLETRLLELEPALAGIALLDEQIDLLIEELDLTLGLDQETRLRQATLAAAMYSRSENARTIVRIAELRILALTRTPGSDN